MENYERGQTNKYVDEKLSFPNWPTVDGITHMKVKSGSRISNILDFAAAQFKPEECRNIIFSGVGSGITKTISCVEIMKKIFKNVGLHQDNKICYQKIEDIWEPKTSDLDRLKVTREVPALYILLSKDPFNETSHEPKETRDRFFQTKRPANREDRPQYGKRSAGGKWQKKSRPKQPDVGDSRNDANEEK